MKIELGNYIHRKKMSEYIKKNPEAKQTKYFTNPMRPGVRLTK